jgi:hypothetical protein
LALSGNGLSRGRNDVVTGDAAGDLIGGGTGQIMLDMSEDLLREVT